MGKLKQGGVQMADLSGNKLKRGTQAHQQYH